MGYGRDRTPDVKSVLDCDDGTVFKFVLVEHCSLAPGRACKGRGLDGFEVGRKWGGVGVCFVYVGVGLGVCEVRVGAAPHSCGGSILGSDRRLCMAGLWAGWTFHGWGVKRATVNMCGGCMQQVTLASCHVPQIIVKEWAHQQQHHAQPEVRYHLAACIMCQGAWCPCQFCFST